MPFNVNEFSSKIGQRGLAKNNLFEAIITPPRGLPLNIAGDMRFLCKSSSLPGFEIGTTDIRKQGWGKVEKRPISFDKTNLALIFMVDSDFLVKRFFDRWIQMIVNYNDAGGSLSEDAAGKLPYEFAYKNEYVTTLEVDVYSDHINNVDYKYKFSNAYPVSVSALEESWENQAEVTVITVSFVYDSMHVSGMGSTSVTNRAAMPEVFQTRDGILGQSLPNLIRSTGIQDIVNRYIQPFKSTIESLF